MFRDWVINALNRDLPFDQFVIEQIAGDLLPGATSDQLVATGFHRNTLINLEGGIDFEQYRVEAVVDRVDTTGAVFLGLTLGCARCHDHKFDPISQREFYQLYSFFNNVDELAGGQGEESRLTAHKPILEFGTPEELARREAFRAQLAALRREFQEFQTSTEAALLKSPDKLKPEVLEALQTPPKKRHEAHQNIVDSFLKETDPGFPAAAGGPGGFRQTGTEGTEHAGYAGIAQAPRSLCPDWRRLPAQGCRSVSWRSRCLAAARNQRNAEPPGSGPLAGGPAQSTDGTGDRESGLATLFRQGIGCDRQ